MAITAGTLSQVAIGNTTDSLLATAATGGTTPYSYQWYRSTVTGFSPGVSNAVSGATALALNDSGLTPGSVYFYKVVVRDSAATPLSASYSQLGVLTQGQNQLSISNVVNISISQAQAGVGEYNVNNLAIFSSDTPADSFGFLGYKIYLSPQDVALDFGTESTTYAMALAVFSQKPNILAGGGYLVIITFLVAETLAQAIVRTTGLVQYFGIIGTEIFSQVDMLAAAAVVQAQNNIAFFVSNDFLAVQPDGLLDLLQQDGFSQSRGLYYGSTIPDALVMLASYASRGLSVAFEGSNTTITLHLKDLIGVSADPSMNQTLLNQCQAAGVDVYISLQGVSKIFCSNANGGFYDQIYNRQWFAGALQVAGFNYLATSSTKVPQTEAGMTGLKGAYRKVCQQGVVNQYLAPGEWTSADTFGNLVDFFANITLLGYYIWSQPISQQSPTARAARNAPLCQIAVKEAGAIHSSDVIIFINA